MPPSFIRNTLPVFGAFGRNEAADVLWYSRPVSTTPYSVTEDCACANAEQPASAASAASFVFIEVSRIVMDRTGSSPGGVKRVKRGSIEAGGKAREATPVRTVRKDYATARGRSPMRGGRVVENRKGSGEDAAVNSQQSRQRRHTRQSRRAFEQSEHQRAAHDVLA